MQNQGCDCQRGDKDAALCITALKVQRFNNLLGRADAAPDKNTCWATGWHVCMAAAAVVMGLNRGVFRQRLPPPRSFGWMAVCCEERDVGHSSEAGVGGVSYREELRVSFSGLRELQRMPRLMLLWIEEICMTPFRETCTDREG